MINQDKNMNDFEGYHINAKNQIVYVYQGKNFITDKNINDFPESLYDVASRELLMIISGMSELPEIKLTDTPPKIKGMGYKG